MPFAAGDLADLIGEYRVPGASLAAWHDGTLEEAAAGVVNLDTKVPATPDTLFQIGSITKLYTGALVMQLVEEGALTLDDPIRTWLPDFKVGDPEATEKVTLRHLLSHTGGIDGDYFKDAGRGEDRISRLVGMIHDLPNIVPLGAMFSYSNVGFVIAGRLIEVATGLTWDKAVRTRLAKPLGTPSFSTLPEQAMRYLTAIGHIGNPDAGLRVTPIAYLAQSNAPAGATPMARARDVIAFACMMMADGVAEDGTRILNPWSIKAMTAEAVACPEGLHIDAIGLPFFLWNWSGGALAGSRSYDVLGHDGATVGQAAWFRFHPASGTAAVLLTNGGNGKGLVRELFGDLFGELTGLRPPAPPEPNPSLALDLGKYQGRYERSAGALLIEARDGALLCSGEPAPDYALFQSASTVRLEPVSETLFVGTSPGMTEPDTYHFLDPDADGAPRILHTGVRAHARVG